MAIDEGLLTKGQSRKLKALKKSVADTLGEEVFLKWMAQQSIDSAPKADPVAERIGEALTEFENDRRFNLGVYGYTVRRSSGKGRSCFVVSKNTWPS